MSTDWPSGYGRRVLQSVDSTNAEAARVAAELSGPEWIFALQQTSARGRRGRAWAQPQGNFSATLVLICDGEGPLRMALRSFVVSLALYDALADITGRTDALSLKWPNDVLMNGGKLAGILLESLPGNRLAIGVGVNLAAAPDAGELEEGAVQPVSLASDAAAFVTPEEFLGFLARAYAKHEQVFREQGFAPIRTAWLQRAARLGEPIRARVGAEEFHGTFTDVDETGNLILTMSTGRREIPAADIYF